MSDSIKIAEERYARGEINIEELQSIKSNLGASSTSEKTAEKTNTVVDSQNVNSKIASGLKFFGVIMFILALGNTFMVLPDEESKLKSMSSSSAALVQKNEIKNIEVRTRGFYMFGIVCLGASFFMNRKR
jgi:hypothetical protein